jgi:hypothetical protein
MATKQTRRSISVRGTTYDTLRKYCDTHERSMSDIVEEQLAKLLETKTLTVKSAPRVQKTVAPKILRAPLPVPLPEARAYSSTEGAHSSAEGRPKPKDAREVIPSRASGAPDDDYRSITF